MSTFIKEGGTFLLDGQDFHLISGAIHYFRVPRAYWTDRLEKLLVQGCNTVETYIPWNLHEARRGEFSFDGMLDLEAFLKLAASMGLKAIVRPSPYICGEFEYGGLPWWLLKDPTMRVRSLHPGFMADLDRYYAELIPRLAALQCTRGGPIIACQIENEYGYYGNDKDYLRAVEALLKQYGMEVLLFTVDGPWGEALEAGSLPGVLATGSFGSGAPDHFPRMKKLRPNDPLVCGEFWMGWFDAWGDEHHTRDHLDAAKSLDEILAQGHVNLYMFHGGTNFGFTAGANHYEELKPDVTSYDYDAPLSESGDITPKFLAFREVIARRSRDKAVSERLAKPLDPASFSTRIVKKALGCWKVEDSVSLDATLDSLGVMKVASHPLTMESFDQGYGYMLYRIRLQGKRKLDRFVLWDCHDRAVIYVNGRPVASQTGNEVGSPLSLELPEDENVVEVLVENQGRVNFGERMNDQRKGLRGAIIIDKHAHGPVESVSLPLDQPAHIRWAGEYTPGTAAFYRVAFECKLDKDQYQDSFLKLDGWGKGVAWVNGHNLGRFWSRGPQLHLYVPGAWLRDGRNELILFETEGQASGSVEFVDHPRLG